MKKSINDNRKSRRGRPPTGTAPMVGVRMSQELQAEIKAWARKQQDEPPLATAIRRLVELGLTVKALSKQQRPGRAERANRLAAHQLDQMVDESASADEQADRKERLLKGPAEFRGVRVDRPKAKGK